MAATMFSGLSAFPLTPADADGIVEAAAETVAGRVPLIVGVGALRTSWAVELARDAERAGADGLLLAPVSYTPLTSEEVHAHFSVVASATRLPTCIYNNPTTTHFNFSLDLLARLGEMSGIAAVKMPLPRDGDVSGEIARLRERAPSDFRIGYSGESGMAASLLAGADAFYSGVAGVLPEPMLKLARAAQAGRVEEAEELDRCLKPLWALCRAHGTLRVIYAIAERLGLKVGDPPAPVQRLAGTIVEEVVTALSLTFTGDKAVP